MKGEILDRPTYVKGMLARAYNRTYAVTMFNKRHSILYTLTSIETGNKVNITIFNKDFRTGDSSYELLVKVFASLLRTVNVNVKMEHRARVVAFIDEIYPDKKFIMEDLKRHITTNDTVIVERKPWNIRCSTLYLIELKHPKLIYTFNQTTSNIENI